MGQKTWVSLQKKYLFAEVMRIYRSACVELVAVWTLMTELINLSFAKKTVHLISLMARFVHPCRAWLLEAGQQSLFLCPPEL